MFGLRSSLNDVSDCRSFRFLLFVKAVKLIEVVAEFAIPFEFLTGLCDHAEEIQYAFAVFALNLVPSG
jgi:hypothetical protein